MNQSSLSNQDSLKGSSLNTEYRRDKLIFSTVDQQIKQARNELQTLLNPDLDPTSEVYKLALIELVLLNNTSPGVIAQALSADLTRAASLGLPYGENMPWNSAIDPNIDLNGKVVMKYTGKNWVDTLPADVRKRVEDVSSREVQKRSQKNENFFDADKPHVANIEVQNDGTVVVEVHKGKYSQNAAISKTLCNALRPLLAHGMVRRVPLQVKEADLENLKTVVSLLRDLGIKDVTEGIDFVKPGSPFPQTLGVSMMGITSDGYLATAVQGFSNLTSQGHTIPLGSGSVDLPDGGTVEGSIIDLSPEGKRELREEQGDGLEIKDAVLLGIVRGSDQGGKPELFYLIELDQTLSEMQVRADKAKSTGAAPSELAKKFGQPFMLGSLGSNIFDRESDNSLGKGYPIRGGIDDEIRFKDIALHPNTNQVLAAGMILMLEKKV